MNQGLAIAVWILIKDGGVLLEAKGRKLSSGKRITHQPIKENIGFKEDTTLSVYRVANEALLKAVGQKCSFASPVDIRGFPRKNKKGEAKGIRLHFMVLLRPDFPSLTSGSTFTLIRRQELSRIQPVSNVRIPQTKDTIVLFDEDYEVLISDIWKIQTTLATAR